LELKLGEHFRDFHLEADKPVRVPNVHYIPATRRTLEAERDSLETLLAQSDTQQSEWLQLALVGNRTAFARLAERIAS
jgi:hypothetical protein